LLNAILFGTEFYPPKFDINIEMKGLKEFVRKLDDGTVIKEHPPVSWVYYTYRIMIYLGSFFGLISLIGLYLLFTNKIFSNNLFLRVLMYSWPLPFIANTAGWYTAEIGRQPYIIYGILKTKDAITPNLNAGSILFTIIVLVSLYIFLTYVALYLIFKIVKNNNLIKEEVKVKSEILPEV
jgi:cytochrome d ubiquinol oxidase subunit I